MKITQDETTFTVLVGKSEMVFLKNIPEDAVRMLEYIIYSLGIDTDFYKVDIKIEPK